jgi:hypothetical protein
VLRDHDDWRRLFGAAADSFAALCAGVPAESWSGPGIGEWSLRDLAGHTSRALLTVEMYLAREAVPVTLDGPVAYLRAAAAASATAEGSRAIATRGRDAGIALGPDVGESTRAIVDRVLDLVDRTADDAPCATPFGGIELADYLPTRTLELTVHSLDMVAALESATPEQLREPVASCLELLAAAVGESDLASDVLLALTGRKALPPNLHVV